MRADKGQELAATTLQGLHRVERWTCTIAFVVLASVLFLDVVLRTLLGNGLAWSHQAGVYANMVVSLLGIGLASASGSHLRPRFADHWLPASWEPLIERLQGLLSALLFLLFAVLATQLVVESIELQERSTVLQSLVWPVQSLLPLAFSIAFVRHLLFALYPQLSPVAQEVAE